MKSGLTVLFLLLACSLFAQNQFDERLLAKFNKEQITTLNTSNPEVIAYWTYFLDHAYSIEDVPAGKDVSTLPEVKIKNTAKLNILELDVHMNRVVPMYYRIKGSNQLLVMMSNEEFSEKFNVHRGLR